MSGAECWFAGEQVGENAGINSLTGDGIWR